MPFVRYRWEHCGTASLSALLAQLLSTAAKLIATSPAMRDFAARQHSGVRDHRIDRDLFTTLKKPVFQRRLTGLKKFECRQPHRISAEHYSLV